MPQREAFLASWRGVALIAATYFYFLIFAQFAFLNRLTALGIEQGHLRGVMAAMALGGVLLSLLAPRLTICTSPEARMRTGFAVCGVAAVITTAPLGLHASVLLALLIGCGLGLLTVTLATHLRRWLGVNGLLFKAGLGTGFGYFLCNIPQIFSASPRSQALAASIACAGGIVVLWKKESSATGESSQPAQARISFGQVLLSFVALVWLDSAAFFIIQRTPELKAGTWEGTLHLWANGGVHFTAALLSAWWLRRRGLSFVFCAAFAALASACLLLRSPNGLLAASVFYPVGVSLYSVALVAYPSLLAPALPIAARGRLAGWIYAVAGWFGSAMGIGMGQNLGHVPAAFVVLAGAVILAPAFAVLFRRRGREAIAACAILATAFGIELAIRKARPAPPALSAAERGRQIYISEGCINCHSQYVRPGSRDVLIWGPTRNLDALRMERPPLIGNRREGPDLAEVGSRRSPLWLKAHLYSPSELSHGSYMPSYAYLFRDRRGDDLVAYLESLQSPPGNRETALHRAEQKAWRLSSEDYATGSAEQGAQLFSLYCATCHAAGGGTRSAWRTSFKNLPPVFAKGSTLPATSSVSWRDRRPCLARIIKFGLPGADMPGHEYFSDRQIASLSLWLAENPALPPESQYLESLCNDAASPHPAIHPGEKE